MKDGRKVMEVTSAGYMKPGILSAARDWWSQVISFPWLSQGFTKKTFSEVAYSYPGESWA